uniref:Uncharacterized protein n=1 Tax=Romanomermis culicivorax TaxID=13658 RepID=A0A915HYB4_ROMCU
MIKTKDVRIFDKKMSLLLVAKTSTGTTKSSMVFSAAATFLAVFCLVCLGEYFCDQKSTIWLAIELENPGKRSRPMASHRADNF